MIRFNNQYRTVTNFSSTPKKRKEQNQNVKGISRRYMNVSLMKKHLLL
jgi:hypothetical protein